MEERGDYEFTLSRADIATIVLTCVGPNIDLQLYFSLGEEFSFDRDAAVRSVSVRSAMWPKLDLMPTELARLGTAAQRWAEDMGYATVIETA